MEKRVFFSEFEAEEMLKDSNSFSLPSLSFFSKRNGIPQRCFAENGKYFKLTVRMVIKYFMN